VSDVVIGPVAPPDLHVMTFNIRRRIAVTLRRRDRWNARRPLVGELLRRERPSLLGVQEALPDQAESVLEALGPDFAFVGRGRGSGGRGEGCPLFYDVRRLELLEWEQVALSDSPSAAGSRSWGNPLPRMFVEATFRDRATSADFTAINTHLDPFSGRSRVRAAHALRLRIAAHDRPCVLTGDLNVAHRVEDLKNWKGNRGKPERLGRMPGQRCRCGRLNRLGPQVGGSEPGQATRNEARPPRSRVDQQPHLTPLVRASAGVLRLRVTGSFAGAGWVAGLLIRLNRREFGREVQNSPNYFRRSGENFIDRLKQTARGRRARGP
jgi:endonuclease/exonuclease/phosphatase family metal-dependent hydrolase